MSMPRRSASTSMSTLPLKTYRPWPSSTTCSISTSYSSLISPTISSRRSSTVTRPAVPPYSSTTMAMGLPALHLLEQLRYSLALRDEIGRPHQRRDWRLGRRGQRDEILDEHNPDD